MNNISHSMQKRRVVILPPTAFTWLLTALVLCTLAACDLSATSEIRSIAIGEMVEINEGDTLRLGIIGPLLRFDDVHQDSRCPTGAECVWAGLAEAGFSFISPAGDSLFTMTIPGLVQTPHEENDVVAIQEYRFTLLELNPYPDAGQTGSPPRYRALIRVERGESAQD